VEPIAIIGIGCRFPGAKDPESFWQLLRNGVDAIAEVPKQRWDIDAFYDPEPGKPGKMSTRWGGFLEQVDQFDPSFFGISPREVERMDPQQRLVLEVAWEAIENAGLAPEQLSGSQTGVFMGIGNYDYCRLLAKDISRVNAYDGTGNTLSIAANRLSYILNLRGPSVLVETACSSSLVALHFACRSLLQGESNMCLVGGASLMLSPEPFITYSHARMMASDGRCKTFDASADGYVRGEGCGVIVLKRLSDALKDKDNILAIVKGTAINQDGLSNGLTAPNGPSQQAVIRQALENAGVTPAQISYVEAHGTGTSLGDPIEFKSLKAVLMQDRKPDQPCWLGSVKTNIGHLEAASGMASVIKVALSLQHKEIPPHLHLKELNPYISLDGTTFAIPTERQPWSPGTEHRLAGISGFGFGGTNCHAILEEAPSGEMESRSFSEEGEEKKGRGESTGSPTRQDPMTIDRLEHLLTLSTKNEKALGELAQRYVDFLATHPEASLADVCFTANTGRSHFDHRLAVVAGSNEQLRERLEAFATGKETAGLVSGQVTSKKRPKIAFLFTGQGSQYVGMGRQLYKTQPIFREALDRCDKILRSYLEQPLLEVLYPESGTSSPLDETAYTQPALFALEYALFQLWKSWGIEPAIVMGHSVGEYTAACIAGVFSLEDGLKLIAERARLMQALPQDGEMVAVFASEAQVAAAIEPYAQDVSIAAINGPQSIVISGKREAVQDAIAALKAEGIKAKKLTVSHAFHSPLMEPMLEAFERVAAAITYSSPKIKLISNVTGELATAEIATPEYWCRHVRQAVKFAAGMETLHQQGYEVFLEIGPKPILLGMGRYCLPEVGVSGRVPLQWLPSLHQGREDCQQLFQSLGILYVCGVPVDWSGLDRDYPRRRLQLPTYPFQRQRYWAECAENGHPQAGNLSQEKVQPSILNLLSQGDSQKLVQQLETTGQLSDEELKLLPKLLELLVKQNQQQLSAASIKDWLYEVEWQPRESQKGTESILTSKLGSWLILADVGGVGQTLAKVLRDHGHNCILVYAGDTYQTKEAGTWSINPSSPADFERLFQEVGTSDRPLQRVVHLWSLQAGLANELTIPSLEQAQTLGVGSVVNLLQGLIKHNKSALPRLWLVTRGAVPVGSSLPAVAQAPLWGLGRVIALEHPELWGGMLDLTPEATEDESTQLLSEIEASQGEDHVAFRNGQRYVARLVRKQLPESKRVSFRADGTYLVTGGLGALGLRIAQWMVQQGARQLVLTGRRGASSQAQETITQLEQAGAKIVVAQADVSNQGDMVWVLEAIAASMPPLRGIIHTAGVLDDGILLQQNWERFTRVMEPKVKGAWNLHVLTKKLPLDFFVVFSSAASLLGSPGQGNYAAANAFMDALAHHRLSLGLPGVSINWGPWGDSGMAASLSSRQQARLSAQGMNTIDPEQGLQVLEQVLGQTLAQIGVLPFELSVFKQQLGLAKQLPLLSQLLGEVNPQEEVEQVSAQRQELLQRLEETPASDRHSFFITYLQREVAKVLGLSLSQLPNVEQGLFDMGMDSLMAMELVSLMRTKFQLEVSFLELLQASNITNLAGLLLKQLMPDVSTLDIKETVLNLNDEAVLDDSIRPDTAYIEQAEAASILLTGATGFLGAFLLHDLLEQTQADIYCLVRSPDLESGKIRLQKNLETYDLWNEQFSSRIIPVLGDLGQPRLGLSAEQFEKMASEIDTIYHNGALLNYIYPYSRFKPINVLGTQEILRLACQTKVKPVHHISSVAVFESSAYYGKTVTESDRVEHSEGIHLGYSQSKWVSEKLVQIAGDRGLPVTIYRPPLVSGHSQTGLWNTDGFLCRMIKGCIQMGSIMADLDLMLDLSPVDYNSQAIVYLSTQKESRGKTFHLQNPQLLHWSQLVDFICSMGYPIEKVSYEDWQIQLSNSQENPLYPLLPFFRHKWSEQQLTYIELNEQGRRPEIGCEETLNALAGTAIVCPPLDSKLLETYFSYFIRSGFVDAPKSLAMALKGT
jgi:malonyl CoA-acyl carrier protein transacylase